MGRAMRGRKQVSSGHRSKLVTTVVAKHKHNTREENMPVKKNQENVSTILSKEKYNLLKQIGLPTDKNKKPSRNILADKTNHGLLSQGMSLRQRSNKSYKIDSTGDSSTSSVNASFNKGVIRSPRPTTLNNSSYSCRSLQGATGPSQNFALMDGIDETSEKGSQPSSNSAQKTCVYKLATDADATKPVQHMLPEEKLKLYEFEVDKNEPKLVKKARKRKIKKKKKLEVSDSSDDSCSMSKMVKRLRSLSTESPARKQPTSLLLKSKENTSVAIKPTVNSQRSLVLPNCSADAQDVSLNKHVQFDMTSQAVNSTPQPIDQHVNMLRLRYRRMLSSPDSSPIAACASDSSLDTNLAMNINYDSSLADSSSSNMEADLPKRPQTPRHVSNLPPLSQGQLQQRKILASTINSPIQKHGDNSSRVDLNKSSNRVLGDLSQSGKRLNLSFAEKVTLRRMYLDSVMPRVSSLEPRDVSSNVPADLNVDNCFGFDDGSEDDEPYSSPTPIKHLSKLKSAIPDSAVCSTPNDSPGPYARRARLPTPKLRRILAPIVATKPVARPHPVSDPTPLLPHVDAVSVSFPSIVSNSCSTEVNPSTSLLFSDSKDLNPVTFADDEVDIHFSKPARRSYDRPSRSKQSRSYNESKYRDDEEEEEETVVKKRKRKPKEYTKTEKKDVENWAANINAQFEAIEDVQLCVE